jgi:hypothetical protein
VQDMYAAIVWVEDRGCRDKLGLVSAVNSSQVHVSFLISVVLPATMASIVATVYAMWRLVPRVVLTSES